MTPLVRLATMVTLVACFLAVACARLPYRTQVVHEDARVSVVLQQEVPAAIYSHPVAIQFHELRILLAGFTFREKQRLPLRWYAEELPPKPIFRADELQLLVPHVIVALQKAGPGERVFFQVRAPGLNPSSEREVTAGWLAVHQPYLYFTLEHFHAQFPLRADEQWDLRYPAIPPSAGEFLLYFEPARFWGVDPGNGRPALHLQDFLKSPLPMSPR